MSIPFSPSMNAFYNPAWESAYKESGNWPADMVMLDDQVFEEYGLNPPRE